ncbi:LOW QUALITY PROTEIN: reverse transcriptase [Phytophthora megakarya]|uniref:Reverse transcriptase n=1 Tax=Phytophthora megakarya TaxID=4795 RepID=A0A225V5B5_9STRA|nr:LOW QUALITY PROTEIN: reverse transcriptase [Phytophthora megakarya]
MRSRRIPADLLSKVYELLKRLLETGLIEYSNSEWASAIVPGDFSRGPGRPGIPGTSTDTVFHQNRVAPEQIGPVLSRSSYIDVIIYGAPSWDDLCKTLNALLYRLRYWNISVSLPKSEFGVKKCKYLGHDISSDGIRTSAKLAEKVLNLPKGVQSFLGGLNYYAKFIEDLPACVRILKDRLVSTPLLQHPDPGRQYVIILHANPWAISAVLGPDHDGTILPVRFVGRVLQDAELRYHPAEKEVLALLRVLNTCHTMITSCSEKKIRVYTRYSVLVWLFKSKTVDGRCLKWAVNLSPWDLDIRRVENDEDGLAAILGAGITPRERLDEVAETLVPTPPVSLEMLSSDHIGHLLSFDGAAKRDGSGSAACILWSLPSWEVMAATGHFLEKATVNETEYSGLVKGTRLALNAGIQELVVVGDSRNTAAPGVIGCTQPHLLRLLQEAEGLQAKFKSLRLVHVKREFNAAADYISKRGIQEQSSLEVTDLEERKLLQGLNRIHEKLMKDPSPREQSLPPPGEYLGIPREVKHS